MSSIVRTICAAMAIVLGLSIEFAASQQTLTHQEIILRENLPTLRIVTGNIGTETASLVTEMAAVLNDPNKMRILPILGGSGVQSVTDLLYLQGVDAGIIRSDALSYVRQQRLYKNVDNRIRYISKLHDEQVHVLVRSPVLDIRDLAGKPVNFGWPTEGKKTTPALVFATLGIEVTPTYLKTELALDRLKSGELAAIVIVGSKPHGVISAIRSTDGLKLLPIEFADVLSGLYEPTKLTNEDYPNLISPGTIVDSLALNVVLATYNWPQNNQRYSKVAEFVKALFFKFHEFQDSSHHPKWREIDVAATLPGWTRFKPAEDWLIRYPNWVPQESVIARLRASFLGFLAKDSAASEWALNEENKKVLFKQFLRSENFKDETAIPIHRTAATGVGEFIGVVKVRNITITAGGSDELALQIKPELLGLSPGPHAFHIHEHANCGPEKHNGASVPGLAGGDLLWLRQGEETYAAHLGNLPGLVAAADGTAKGAIVLPRLTVADILDRSIMIHTTGSDLSPRFACGLVK